MIIICKGIKKQGRIEPCKFVYDGNWGDDELIEHEKYHQDQTFSFWLGFDTPQLFGTFSGRDGKRK